MKRYPNRLFLVAIMVLLMLPPISSLVPQTSIEGKSIVPDMPIIVDHRGNGNYTSIQEAIDNATDGDVIEVWSGTYIENIYINKSVALVGNGTDETTIDGNGWFDVVKIEADDVTISDFNMINSGNSYFFQDNDAGVKLVSSDDCTVSDCYFTNTSTDIWLEGSNNNTFTDNVFNWTYLGGVSVGVSNSNYNSFTDNVWHHEYNFTYFIPDKNETITLDESHISRICILLASSYENELTGNAMRGKGLVIDPETFTHYMHEIDETNTVKGKPIYYLVNEFDVEIPSNAGQVMLVYSNNCRLSGAVFDNMEESVLLIYSDNNTISNCEFKNSSWGIHLVHSNGNQIRSNSFYMNLDPIFLDTSNGNIIEGNQLSSNEMGITLGGSDDNIIDGNSLNSNAKKGISLTHSDTNIICNNTITSNLLGISLESSTWNRITNNTISASKTKGFHLYPTANDNQIYHNNLVGNTIQVSDSGHNTWYLENEGGNYWSDYVGDDDGSSERDEGDGIGDTNLTFHGLDLHPFMEEWGWRDIDEKEEEKEVEDVASNDGDMIVPYEIIGVMVVFMVILVIMWMWSRKK